MAFEFISINRIVRKSERQPNYQTVIKYDNRDIDCDIYTNILILNNGRMFCNKVNLSTKLNGDFYFRLEALNCNGTDRLILEQEIIRYAKNQNKFK